VHTGHRLGPDRCVPKGEFEIGQRYTKAGPEAVVNQSCQRCPGCLDLDDCAAFSHFASHAIGASEDEVDIGRRWRIGSTQKDFNARTWIELTFLD
jgi:hypothetical protein